jgi:hypothetical protein
MTATTIQASADKTATSRMCVLLTDDHGTERRHGLTLPARSRELVLFVVHRQRKLLALSPEQRTSKTSCAASKHLILSQAQLACLKAAVTIGSEDSAALGRGVRFGNKVLSPELFAVKCTRQIANRLLAVAKRHCPEVVPEMRAAIERDRATEAT